MKPVKLFAGYTDTGHFMQVAVSKRGNHYYRYWEDINFSPWVPIPRPMLEDASGTQYQWGGSTLFVAGIDFNLPN